MELAVFNDCRELVENFVKSGNFHFESFCLQWKRMHFQHIYSAQTTNVELLQTTLTALHIAKRIVCGRDRITVTTNVDNNEEQLHRRICGIYLMYGIYFKQPTAQYIKIEVSLRTWKEIRAFVDVLPTMAVADEVRYIFWKLVQAHAFSFTASDYCVGLENLVDFDKIEDEQSSEDKSTSTNLSKELEGFTETQQILPALIVLEDGYNEMKEMLARNTDVSAKSLPPTAIFKDIRNVFQNIQTILSSNGSERESKEVSNKNVESKKRNLKHKHYRFNEPQDNDSVAEDTEGGAVTSYNTRAHRRMSARTVFSEPLPGDIIGDLQEDDEEKTND